jgi:hypothetical protein
MRQRCFCCGKKIRGAIGGLLNCSEMEPPSGAVVFTSRGNYGSTVLDIPSYDESLSIEIVICDICVLKNRKRINTITKRIDIHYDSTPGLPKSE